MVLSAKRLAIIPLVLVSARGVGVSRAKSFMSGLVRSNSSYLILKIITRLLGAIVLIMTIQAYAACEFSVEVGDNLEYSFGEWLQRKAVKPSTSCSHIQVQ